jgi:hypothetical protein
MKAAFLGDTAFKTEANIRNRPQYILTHDRISTSLELQTIEVTNNLNSKPFIETTTSLMEVFITDSCRRLFSASNTSLQIALPLL